MDEPERPGQAQAEPVGVGTKEDLRQEVEQAVKEENDQDEQGQKQHQPGMHGVVQHRDQPAEDEKVGEGVPDENGPEEVLRPLEKPEQHPGAPEAGPGLLPEPEPAEREDPASIPKARTTGRGRR